jgi:CRISPR-associated protein Cas1
MIARVIYIGNPAYLSVQNRQLCIQLQKNSPDDHHAPALHQRPIEEIGLLIIDHHQITITQNLIIQITEAGGAILFCNQKHMPIALNLPLYHHHLIGRRVRAQISAPLPLNKRLWQQLITAKINNQAALIAQTNPPAAAPLYRWAAEVRTGDPDNLESRAANHYWQALFGHRFKRQPQTDHLNTFLDYSYAILRAVTARALVAAGLLPIIGIFHHNQYNPYPLADDLMEPFRPWCDKLVKQIIDLNKDKTLHPPSLSAQTKKQLLQIPMLDTRTPLGNTNLQTAVLTAARTLAGCFLKKRKHLLLPTFNA